MKSTPANHSKKGGSPPREPKPLPALRESPSLQITDNLPEMVFEYHKGNSRLGRFTYLNNATRDLFEMDPQWLRENPNLAWRQFHQDDVRGLKAEMKNAAADLEEFKWQGRLVTHKTYQLKWVRIHARPSALPDGSVKWQGVMTDITRLKAIERELEYARKRAVKEAKSKEDFLATMSHEIRTPLNGIVGMTELLLMDAPSEDPEQLEQLELLQFSANNLMSLINNILDFSKLNSGKMMVTESKTALRRVMESLRQMHNFKALENRTLLKIHIDPSIPEVVLADEMIFMQIMNNLIGNAIKFTKDGFVTIRMKMEEQQGHHLHLRVSVKDTGVGIDDKDLDRIFYEFEQAEGGINHKGGTGLGLPICKKLVELHGGDLEAVSTPGVGSEFFFTIRMKTLKEEAATNIKKMPTTIERPVKVLVVDDMEDNRKIVKNFFKRWGNITWEEAANGKKALELFEKEDFDLILLDLRMPVMDGWEACRRVRAMKNLDKATTPIVAITADTYTKKSMKKFTDVLTKPFSPHDLLGMLIKHTDQQTSQDYSNAQGLTG